jgi:hypothetical protein
MSTMTAYSAATMFAVRITSNRRMVKRAISPPRAASGRLPV